MQLGYGLSQYQALIGMLASSSFKHTDSGIAAEALYPGRAVVRVPNTQDQVRNASADYTTLSLNADFGGTDAVTVTVDGVVTGTVTYASSHANTMNLLLAAIQGLSTVAYARLATTAEDANNRTVYIKSVAATAVVSMTDIADAPPAETITYAQLATDIFGIAQLSNTFAGALPNEENSATIAAKTMANVLRRGRIWAQFETTFDNDKDTLYVRHTAASGKVIGSFGNVSDSAKCVSLAGLPIRVVSNLANAISVSHTASTALTASNVTTVTIATPSGNVTAAATYGTSHLATMNALVSALNALPAVTRAYLDVSNNLILNIILANGASSVTIVTAGGSAVTWTTVPVYTGIIELNLP